MCTVVIHRDPDAPWPVVLAANRDEMANRPWRPPARYWDEHPHVIAGIDEIAGGTWMGVNDDGLVAAILNRPGSLGPAPDKRSRGELPLEALSHAEAREAADALSHLDGRAYRSFNLIVADAREAFWLKSTGETSKVEAHPVPDGVSMLASNDLNSSLSPRMTRYLPLFGAAARPDPDTGDWTGWQQLIASRDSDVDPGEGGAMNVGNGDSGFTTICSSLVALPGPERFGEKPKWLFAAGAPDRTLFAEISFAD